MQIEGEPRQRSCRPIFTLRAHADLAIRPRGHAPKVHISSPSVEPVEEPGEDEQPAAKRRVNPRQHGDWIDGVDFIAFLREMGDTHVDVMLEAKQKDLALLRVCEDIADACLQTRIW